MKFFGPSMTEKTVVESEGEENFREFPVTVEGRGPSDARFSRTRTRVCARCWALTKPERLHCRLRITETERSIDPLLLTEPE